MGAAAGAAVGAATGAGAWGVGGVLHASANVASAIESRVRMKSYRGVRTLDVTGAVHAEAWDFH
jgi:hypothetical protein